MGIGRLPYGKRQKLPRRKVVHYAHSFAAEPNPVAWALHTLRWMQLGVYFGRSYRATCDLYPSHR